jgi:hypothetical protein
VLVFGFAAITKIADIGLRYDHIAAPKGMASTRKSNMFGRYWLVALALLFGFADFERRSLRDIPGPN